MPGTLIYSPDVEVLISSEIHGTIDVSKDIVSGGVTLNQNRPHTMNLVLDNPRRKYDGAFLPNDRFIVRLKRLAWVQVMSGYLDSVPFASVWPRAVSLTGSCTLKRLVYLLYDEGTQAMADLINEFSVPGAPTDDGNLSERAKAVLTRVAEISEENIHVGDLPADWWSTVSDLYSRLSVYFDASIVDLSGGTTGSNVPPGAVVNADVGDPSIMGGLSVTVQEMAAWYRSQGRADPTVASLEQICQWFHDYGANEGVRGDLCFAHSCWETGYFRNTDFLTINNFGGIGHYDDAPSGFGYPSPSQGVLGMIQLYKKYALGNDVALHYPAAKLTDGTEVNGPGGGHTTLYALAGTWATDPALASGVQGLFAEMLGLAGKSISSETESLPSDAAPPQSTPNPSLFVFPLPAEYQGTYSDNFGNYRPRNDPNADHSHDGIDISCPVGTPVFAVADGIVQVNRSLSPGGGGGNPGGAGRNIRLTDASDNLYVYLHLSTILPGIEDGTQVTAGQQIATAGGTGTKEDSYAPHLHIEWRPGGVNEENIYPLLTGAAAPTGGGTPGAGAPSNSTDVTTQLISGAFLTQATSKESTALAGVRRLMNDGGSNVHDLMVNLFGASMRNYCSAPNGDIIAWFPDYFDNYGTAGKAVIEDIELIDFTINFSDSGMVTHQFVTGTFEGLHDESNPLDLGLRFNTHGIASIDFPEILEALFGADAGFWSDADAIYSKFGPRPNYEGVSSLLRNEATGSSGEFFYAVHKFMFNWAAMFTASTEISFMPELWPGMIMQIPSQGIQVYINQVTHSWNMQTGFSTRVQVISPSSLDGSFSALPQASSLSSASSNTD